MNKRQKEVIQASIEDEKEVIRKLKKAYKQASKDCEDAIAALNARTDMQNLQSIIYQKQYQEALKNQIDGILNQLQTNEFSSVAEYLTTCYENGYIGAMYDLQGQGIPITVPIDQNKVVKAVETDSQISTTMYERLGEDVEKLKKDITSELSRGTASGKGWLEMANSIANGMNSPFNKARNNSIRIARTEGHRIQQASKLDACNEAKAKGADVVKQWDATLDSRTRPDHAAADGQIRELDEYFNVGGEKMEAPGIGGSARNVCNCRCQLTQRARYALDEDELETLKERAEYFGLDKTSDFEEYKQKYLNVTDDGGTILDDNKKIKYYKRFDMSDQEGYDNWVNNYYSINEPKLTNSDKKALGVYSDGSYDAINGACRFEKGSEQYNRICRQYGVSSLDGYIKDINAISKAIDKFELTDDIVSHRYVPNVEYITGATSSVDDIIKSIGNEYTDKGFFSTCIFEGQTKHMGGKDPIHIEVLIPKTANGAYINNYSEKKNLEFEFLLNKGTNFKILDGGERKITVNKFDVETHKWVDKEETEKYLKLEVLP